MKRVLCFLILISILISGCTTRAIWKHTLSDTHDRTYKEEITEEQLAAYKKMAETNPMIQVDPVTEVVFIKKKDSKRISEIALAVFITPFALLIDIPLFLIFEGNDKSEKH